MSDKKYGRLYGVSLLVISLSSLLLSLNSLFDWQLPRAAFVIPGVLVLAALPVLVFSAIRLWIKKP